MSKMEEVDRWSTSEVIKIPPRLLRVGKWMPTSVKAGQDDLTGCSSSEVTKRSTEPIVSDVPEVSILLFSY